MRKGVAFDWGNEQEAAFRELQRCLVSEPVQVMFRADAAVTELHTDASASGLGAVLLQAHELGGPLHVVYYASRKTSDAETRLTTTQVNSSS